MSEYRSTVFETILLQLHARVGVITINRPKALNALNRQVMAEVTNALGSLNDDPNIGCIVLTGSNKAFAAGADIKEMQEQSFIDVYAADWFAGWDVVGRIRKPIIAAVSGFALGGGCELAMACDFIIAADSAKFGQPEIKLGVIPGMGGSQRLARAIGKAKAMEMCLTGRMMDASEAERAGLVARVVPTDELLSNAIGTAEVIASMSLPAAMMMKEAINRSHELSLSEGIRFERRLFHSTFATHDQKEGMTAFVEKRAAKFLNR
jgi:enoyl-CoA hydratase